MTIGYATMMIMMLSSLSHANAPKITVAKVVASIDVRDSIPPMDKMCDEEWRCSDTQNGGLPVTKR